MHSPKAIVKAIIELLSKFAYAIDFKYKKVAKVNLDLAFEDTMSEDEKTRIIKKCYKNMLYLLKEFIENQNISKENLLNKVTFHNEHIYQNAFKQNKKIIFLTAHYGIWELLPLAIGAKICPMSVIGRKLDSPKMNEILEKNRQQFNITLFEKKGAMRGMLKALSNGSSVGLLVDQNTSEQDGILVSFFGKLVRHTPAAAQIARKTGATIIPVFITTNDYEKFDITFYDEISTQNTDDNEEDIRQSVQAQANITQKMIEKKPDEWFWFHKRWKNQYESFYQ